MQQPIDKEEVISYYNEHVKQKLRDYIVVNPRVEEAWVTIKKFSPKQPRRILEVGCGIGSISSRLKGRWPSAEVTALDISTQSIEIARILFERPGLKYLQGILLPETFDVQFDLIVFMDVYEHIAPDDRQNVHAALEKILADKGRIIITVPTPHNLKWSLKHKPETMQPVDEHISLETISKLALDTRTEVILYAIKDIWNVGDYTHAVLERNTDFEDAFFRPKPVTVLMRGERIFNKVIYRLGSIFRKMYVLRKLK